MKTNLSPENPFSFNRYGYLWESIKKSGKYAHHLDYGCYNGNVIKSLLSTGVISSGVGVDKNTSAIEIAKLDNKGSIQFLLIGAGSVLPFEDNSFDSISVLDVIEHIHEQKLVLDELHRILKPSGILIMTVPQKHVFSFFDLGNFKFIFPELHKLYYSFRFGKQMYLERYVICENGLIGDVEKTKSWHEHFSKAGLAALAEKSGFTCIDTDGAGLFYRPLSVINLIFPFLNKPLLFLLKIDSKYFSSCHLYSTFKKV